MSDKSNDGGPAFPWGGEVCGGMTLRDWFAGQAIAGSIQVPPAEQCPNCGKWYHMGHCRHSSTASDGRGYASTLYGVCSQCAESHQNFFQWARKASKEE